MAEEVISSIVQTPLFGLRSGNEIEGALGCQEMQSVPV
jgi:hypothetical protein